MNDAGDRCQFFMNDPEERCPQCQHEVAPERLAGLVYCSHCGTPLSQQPLAGESNPDSFKTEAKEGTSLLTEAERQRLWICFWILLLATPCSVLLLALASQGATRVLPSWVSTLFPDWLRYVLSSGGCAAGAAYCLTRLRNVQRPWAIWVHTLALAIILVILIALVCGALILGGCYLIAGLPGFR